MTTPESPDITVLALFPPSIPEATTPVVGAHYGVPQRAYDLKPEGLKVDIPPALAGTVRPGDVIALVLNGETKASKPIERGEENAVNTLYLPKGLLLSDRLNELVYTITRGSQNIGTSTPVLTLLYNAIRPGMEDRTPGDKAHSELKVILPQDVTDDGIDADRAKQGVLVCCSYPFCRPYDYLRLNLNGQDVYRTVTVAEAPAIPSPEPTTICVMVEEAVFVAAKDNPKFPISFTVTDQLGNGPDTDSPWSGAELVDVHLAERRLVKPDVAEDPDDPSDDPNTIDLGKLGTKDLTVLVHVFAPQWQSNDKIRVSYSATLLSGAVVEHTVEMDVARTPFTYKLMVPNAKVIAESVVRVKYEQVRNGAVFATSKITTVEVIGRASVDLLPPFPVAPAVSPIDPLAYPKGVTVRIEHLGALEGDRARLVELNPPAGSPQFPLVAFNSNKRTNTILTPAFLAERQGKDIELRWNLNRNDAQIGKSPVLKLSVLKIADGDARLPTPVIAGRTGQELDVSELVATDALTIAQWLGQEVGQFIWLRYDGIDKNGNATEVVVFSGTEYSSASGLSSPIPLEWFGKLKNYSSVKITFKVNFDRMSNESTAVSFPVRSYITAFKIKLVMETSGIRMSGYKLFHPTFTMHPRPNYSRTRTPSQGNPPYSYSSSAPLVAQVNSSTGTVTGLRNGSATITVTDETKQTSSYIVQVVETYDLKVEHNQTRTGPEALAYIRSIGGAPIAQIISTLLNNSLVNPTHTLLNFDASNYYIYNSNGALGYVRSAVENMYRLSTYGPSDTDTTRRGIIALVPRN
ncbi:MULTISPECIES: Ig-like domain-containing protein [Pseudomonas]|uniref:Ig-like domain-containing protein n=1 Tax=Pseudomonas wuhanensis TaxID=2954098 RepID=A0ABY9GWM2_9PSED|nr:MULTISPECIES: Ig-like domain-containing protein [unclassified Pseudomonas]WLI14023.1 Ig-like domain-containing protein [Pseudomonas sp. FP603]WLI19926.1 Ig-like domain-containing protein [Pseudomonas sp. FP607]